MNREIIVSTSFISDNFAKRFANLPKPIIISTKCTIDGNGNYHFEFIDSDEEE